LNAFGNKPSFVDKGIRRRAICAVGKQDVNPSHIIPYDLSIEVLGGSSDHLILDVTESNTSYKVGDKLSFRLAYGGCLSSMTSSYVYKSFIE
jgi:predicted amino acid racemase